MRNWFLATTALALVVSVSSTGAQSGTTGGDRSGGAGNAATVSKNHPIRAAEKGYFCEHAAGKKDAQAPAPHIPALLGSSVKDRNREFLRAYGYLALPKQGSDGQYFVDNIFVSHSTDRYRGCQRVAVPIKGKGTNVSKIIVEDAPYSGHSSFTAAIYSSRHGHPGNLIVGGNGRADAAKTRIDIPETFLTAGKKYWVVESVSHIPSGSSSTENAVMWNPRNRGSEKGYYQYYAHLYSSASSYSIQSKWLPISGLAPFVRVE
ncbi:MAG TPA: hypothetical protein VHX61_12990 [Rhizomicrobium sp.]|jgi:hypothetical protein|nr:hypothetical protein [Rhizomicrobium sp.]